MILNATNRKLQVVLGEAKTTSDCPVVASYFDSATALSGGPQLTNTNGTTAVDVVAAPAASTVRQINELTVQNADTVSHNVTVRYNDNTTLYTIMKATLAPGYTLTYSKSLGWAVMSPTGLFIAGQIPGTNTNDNAAVGMVGEIIAATSSAIALTSTTATDLTSISITPGDWLVDGNIYFLPSGGSLSACLGWVNTASATEPTRPSNGHTITVAPSITLAEISLNPRRFSVASNTTIFLTARGDFSAGSCTATGIINAYRRR